MSPEEIAQYLEEDEVSGKLQNAKIARYRRVSFDSSVGRAVDCSGE